MDKPLAQMTIKQMTRINNIKNETKWNMTTDTLAIQKIIKHNTSQQNTEFTKTRWGLSMECRDGSTHKNLIITLRNWRTKTI